MIDLIVGVLFISLLVVGVVCFLHYHFKEDDKKFFIFCLILIFSVFILIYYRHYTRDQEIYTIVQNTDSIEKIKEDIGEYFEN